MELTVEPKLSANDWQLYTYGVDAAKQEAAHLAAARLNRTLREAVNGGFGRPIVRDRMWKVMEECRSTGALDTEPRAVLETLLDFIFGEEI
jgi:hypothetical protein